MLILLKFKAEGFLLFSYLFKSAFMFKSINIVPRWIIFLIDLSICSFAFVFSSLIKHNLTLEGLNLHDLGGNLLIIVLINSIVFINFRIYAGIIRYTGVQDALRICYAIAMSTSVLFFISLVSSNSGSALFFFQCYFNHLRAF